MYDDTLSFLGWDLEEHHGKISKLTEEFVSSTTWAAKVNLSRRQQFNNYNVKKVSPHSGRPKAKREKAQTMVC